MKMGMLDNRKWKKRVMAFRAAGIMAASAVMTSMPAVMAAPSEDAVKTALKVVFSIIFNVGLILGIIMVGHGAMVLITGHAEQQSPEQARSIREIAAGAVLIVMKIIIPASTLVDLVTLYTYSDV